MLANRIECRAEEVHIADACDLDRILKSEKDAVAGAFFGWHREQVFALINDFALSDLISLAFGEHVSESALARSIRAHDGVDFTGVNREVYASQDLIVADAGVQVFDF